jgi:hypothetical protein
MSCGALYVKKKLHEGAVAIGDGDILPILDHRQQAMRTVTLQVEGISGDTIVPKVSIDGVTYYATQVLPVGSATPATSITADGIYRANVIGCVFFKAEITVWAAGDIDVVAVLTAE